MQDGFCFSVLKVRVLYHFKRQVQSNLAYSEYSFVQVFINWMWFICRLFCSPKCSFNFNLTWSSVVGIVIVESFISFTFFHTHLLSQSINGLLDKNVFAGDVNNQRFYRLCVLIVKTLTSLVALLKPARERQSKILKCVRHELHDYFLSLKQ